MFCVETNTQPFVVVTVHVAVKVPTEVYAWVGVADVEVVPSPKFQTTVEPYGYGNGVKE